MKKNNTPDDRLVVGRCYEKDNYLRDFQRILHDSDSQNETVHEHAIQIMEWLKKLIEETKKELKKYENPHS